MQLEEMPDVTSTERSERTKLVYEYSTSIQLKIWMQKEQPVSRLIQLIKDHPKVDFQYIWEEYTEFLVFAIT